MGKFRVGLAIAGLFLLTLLVGVAAYFFVASVAVSRQSPPAPAAVMTVETAVAPTTAAPRDVTGLPAPDTPVPTVDATAPPPTAAVALSTPPTEATPPPDAPGVLIIPSLAVTQTVTLVPVVDGRWDISQLGSQIGRLQTTGAHPGDAYAMTFTGHVTRPWPEIAGPFADLVFLERGEEVIYRWQGIDYVYQVSRIFRADPRAVDLLYVPDGDSIVLVTCSGWDFVGREYAERLVTRATLVEKRPSPQEQSSVNGKR